MAADVAERSPATEDFPALSRRMRFPENTATARLYGPFSTTSSGGPMVAQPSSQGLARSICRHRANRGRLTDRGVIGRKDPPMDVRTRDTKSGARRSTADARTPRSSVAPTDEPRMRRLQRWCGIFPAMVRDFTRARRGRATRTSLVASSSNAIVSMPQRVTKNHVRTGARHAFACPASRWEF